MNTLEYIKLAQLTAKQLPPVKQVWHANCGIITEVGELLDAYKRYRIYGKPLDVTNLLEELGDIAWYVALLLHTLHSVSPSGKLDSNCAKFDASELERSKPGQVNPAEVWSSSADAALATLLTLGAESYLSYATLEEEEVFYQMNLGIARAMGILRTVSDLAHLYGSNLYTVMAGNIAKLSARFPDNFSEHSALVRDLAVEREILVNKLTPTNALT